MSENQKDTKTNADGTIESTKAYATKEEALAAAMSAIDQLIKEQGKNDPLSKTKKDVSQNKP